MKKIKSVVFRVSILFLALVLVFVTPFLTFLVGDDLSLIYSTFIGKKSEYQGIIEVWNIDSFESGSVNKASYIEKVAQKFQKENKGTYVVIRNLTQGECQNLLAEGEIPDVFSCSYGVSELIKTYIKPYENIASNVADVFLNAGKINEELYALAWCVGFYCLISTKSKIEKAGIDADSAKLNEIVYDAGFEYKSGKHMKKSISLGFGTGLYLMPKNSLNAYNKARSVQLIEKESEENIAKTGYSAYCSFLANETTILLGTHRDVCRMKSREEKGKVSDVIYLPLNKWTDLVQYAFVTKKGNEARNILAEKFALFMVDMENQKDVDGIGLASVIAGLEISNNSVMRDIIPENFSDLELKSVF